MKSDVPPLVLASTSAYRRELLQRLQLKFECVPPGLDEVQHAGETPESMAARLAAEKAQAVAARFPGAIVIGSDQAASLDGRALGKPGSVERAREQLRACAGREIVFHTAVCVVDAHGRAHGDLDTTTVRFRALSAADVDRYLAREPALDCAGSFKSEGLGIALFDAIDSRDPTALVGLPLIAVCRLLRAAGVALP